MRSPFLPLALVAILLCAAAPLAAAQVPSADPNLSVNQWVDAAFTVTQPDLSTMDLAGQMLVRQYEVDGEALSADDMGDRYRNVQKYPQTRAKGDELVQDLEAQIRSTFENSLRSSFPGATITVTDATIDRATLVAGNGNPYDPAVGVTVAASVVRTSEQVGTGDLSDAAVEAAFKSGAAVSTTFSLSSQAGYNSVYTIHAPESPANLAFTAADGAALTDAGTIQVTIDNTAGDAALAQDVTITLKDTTATPPTAEDVRTTVEFALGSVDASSLPVSADVSAELRAINLRERFAANDLPPSVSIDFLSADALRALVQTGAIKPADLDAANDAFINTVHANLNASGFETARPTGGILPADLARDTAARYGMEPPLRFVAQASGVKPLEEGDGDKLDVALRIGATIKMDTTLPASANGPTTFVLTPPGGTEFVSESGESLATASFDVEGEDMEAPLRLRLIDRPVFTAKSADLGIVVDLQDIDISIGKAIGGDLGNLIGEITIRGELGVLALDDLPEDTRASLAGQADLAFLPSDGIRLAKQKGILTSADLAAMEKEMLDRAGVDIGNALGAIVTVTGGFDAATLDPALISTGKLSGDTPIVFEARASFTKPLSGGGEPQMQAMALHTQTQTFELPRLQGLDTAYKVILPAGLSVEDLQVTGGEKETATEPDGRESFSVRPTDETATATVSMGVTPSFVVAKFWPVLLLAVLILFLLVGSPIAFVVMRKRRKNAAAQNEE